MQRFLVITSPTTIPPLALNQLASCSLNAVLLDPLFVPSFANNGWHIRFFFSAHLVLSSMFILLSYFLHCTPPCPIVATAPHTSAPPYLHHQGFLYRHPGAGSGQVFSKPGGWAGTAFLPCNLNPTRCNEFWDSFSTKSQGFLTSCGLESRPLPDHKTEKSFPSPLQL